MTAIQNTQRMLPPHFSVNCFPHDGLRYTVYTGPDGLANHRAHLLVDKRPIGTNPYTREATYDTEYLWRSPPGTGTPVHLRPRSSFAGEIGWHNLILGSPESPWTGHQILTSEFWRDTEDFSTHRYQNPWYPGPREQADPRREGSYFRIFPRTGQRSRTSHDFRSNTNQSTLTSGTHAASSRSRQQPWRRAPAATPITQHGDADVVSAEASEEGAGGGSADEGNVNRLLKRRHSPADSREQEENSISTHSPYPPQHTPSSSSSQRRIHFQ